MIYILNCSSVGDGAAVMIQTVTLSNVTHQLMGHSHGQVLVVVDVVYRQKVEDEARADMNEANYTPTEKTTTVY